jgi:hypothetical protein
MTIIELRLLKEQISADSIKQLLISGSQIDSDKTTSMHVSADLSSFETCWGGLVDKKGKLSASSDQVVCIELHKALSGISRRTSLDPKFWMWLSIDPLREYVIARWGVDLKNITEANLGRFSCVSSNSSLGSTNALSRLYWASDAVYQTSGTSYSSIDAVIGIADLHKTLFTNSLSLDTKLVVAACKELSTNYRELVSRDVIKTLGAVRLSTMYAAISDTDLQILIKDIRDRAELKFP